jgi:CRISPR-associated endonuclease Cas1
MIIDAKLRNQLHLVKYFHKYHKAGFENLLMKYEELCAFYDHFKTFIKTQNKGDKEFIVALVAQEAQGALKYWAYIHELLLDDQVGFEKREHKGATDLVNCMLNYGYAILYSRVWQALLAAKLNPFDSIIHVRQAGKPTFVYDVVEMFRSQVVDRVVIALIQKGHSLGVKNNLLTDDTKKLLAGSVLDRLNRYEKFRGEEISLEQIIRRQAYDIANWIDHNKEYKPYVAKW